MVFSNQARIRSIANGWRYSRCIVLALKKEGKKKKMFTHRQADFRFTAIVCVVSMGKGRNHFHLSIIHFFLLSFFFHLWILEKKKSEPINIIYCSIFFRSELFKREILLFLPFLIFLFVKKKNFFRKGRFFVCFSIYSISSSLSSFVTHFVETSKIQEALCYVHLDRLFLFASLNGESERKY